VSGKEDALLVNRNLFHLMNKLLDAIRKAYE